jgi:hypothetical protein
LDNKEVGIREGGRGRKKSTKMEERGKGEGGREREEREEVPMYIVKKQSDCLRPWNNNCKPGLFATSNFF